MSSFSSILRGSRALRAARAPAAVSQEFGATVSAGIDGSTDRRIDGFVSDLC
jgi:hypothetical protein